MILTKNHTRLLLTSQLTSRPYDIAAAHVAGLAAYFIALNNNLGSPQDVKDLIIAKSWSRLQDQELRSIWNGVDFLSKPSFCMFPSKRADSDDLFCRSDMSTPLPTPTPTPAPAAPTPPPAPPTMPVQTPDQCYMECYTRTCNNPSFTGW